MYQSIGENVILDCDIQSNPVSKVYWFKNNSLIHESAKYQFEILENNFYRLFINNLTEDDFGTYHLRAVNMVGKSSAKLELLELPVEITPIPRSTKPPKPVSIEIHKIGLFNVDRNVANKTEMILSKIYNDNKNKNMKNNLHIEVADSSEDVGVKSSYEQKKYPYNFPNSNNRSGSDYFSKNLARNQPPQNLDRVTYKNSKNKQFTSTLQYHVLQIENDSTRIEHHFKLYFVCIISVIKLNSLLFV